MLDRLHEVADVLGMPVVQRGEGALLFVLNDDGERVFVYELEFGSGELDEPRPSVGTSPVCSFPVSRIEQNISSRQENLVLTGDQKDGTTD